MACRTPSVTRILILGAGLLACAARLPAQNHERILPVSDPAYGLLEKLFLEQGLAVPFQVLPTTEEEILHSLRRIDRSALSAAGRLAYDEVLQSVSHRTLFGEGGTFAFNASGSVAIEGYARANADVNWQYDYGDRRPILDPPAEFWAFDGLYGNITATLKEEHRLLDDPANA